MSDLSNSAPSNSPYEVYDSIVGQFFRIEARTFGERYLVKYTGYFVNENTAEIYDRLAEKLKPYDLTPLFRWERDWVAAEVRAHRAADHRKEASRQVVDVQDDRQAIILVKGIPKPAASNPRINLIMFILTLISVIWTGAATSGVDPFARGVTAAGIGQFFLSGLPFAVSMLAILTAHEFGHYLAGRFHGANVSLPYFLPLPYPISPFGTFGAFINMREPPKNRRVLLDIGVAGPFSGLVVAIVVLAIGLHFSKIMPLPTAIPSGSGLSLEGNSILYLLMKYVMFGQLLPHPASYGSLGPVLYWLRYFFTGLPLPLGGMDVSLHPVAWAGWGGILVTALNLIPAGQLDGGHMLYVLFGPDKARKILPFILGALGILGIFWNGWWLWVALIFFFGRFYAEPLDQVTTLDMRRKLLALLALLVFILVFAPIPLTEIIGR